MLDSVNSLHVCGMIGHYRNCSCGLSRFCPSPNNDRAIGGSNSISRVARRLSPTANTRDQANDVNQPAIAHSWLRYEQESCLGRVLFYSHLPRFIEEARIQNRTATIRPDGFAWVRRHP